MLFKYEVHIHDVGKVNNYIIVINFNYIIIIINNELLYFSVFILNMSYYKNNV